MNQPSDIEGDAACAERVRSAASNLQSAIEDARRRGLAVEVRVLEVEEVGTGTTPLVSVEITRPL